MAHDDIYVRIGDAWGMYREGQHAAAIAEFERIVAQKPDEIDAHYGLGLALRAAGQQESAVTAFQKALKLVDAKLSPAAADKYSTIEVETETLQEALTEDTLVTGKHDRFTMLKRMTGQRLTELGVNVPVSRSGAVITDAIQASYDNA
ncbi:MAG: tetratricopeptide repeat protein [Burkholderiales bacterium]|nr:tetratricopeptide repeat protein [Anaerolineae bacterium]